MIDKSNFKPSPDGCIRNDRQAKFQIKIPLKRHERSYVETLLGENYQ